MRTAATQGTIGGMTFLRYLRAVLWSFVGLGGRRQEADGRVSPAGILPTIAIAFVLVILFVVLLVSIAKYASS